MDVCFTGPAWYRGKRVKRATLYRACKIMGIRVRGYVHAKTGALVAAGHKPTQKRAAAEMFKVPILDYSTFINTHMPGFGGWSRGGMPEDPGALACKPVPYSAGISPITASSMTVPSPVCVVEVVPPEDDLAAFITRLSEGSR